MQPARRARPWELEPRGETLPAPCMSHVRMMCMIHGTFARAYSLGSTLRADDADRSEYVEACVRELRALRPEVRGSGARVYLLWSYVRIIVHRALVDE